MAFAIIHHTQKDGHVHWISNFQESNKYIERKVYNLAKIQDILNHQSRYKYFTKLDVSMQRSTCELNKKLCTICTLFGNNCYNQLPMGASQAPDISQEIMEDLFHSFNEVDIYISMTLEFAPMTSTVNAFVTQDT
jgi:hypothetical protein